MKAEVFLYPLTLWRGGQKGSPFCMRHTGIHFVELISFYFESISLQFVSSGPIEINHRRFRYWHCAEQVTYHYVMGPNDAIFEGQSHSCNYWIRLLQQLIVTFGICFKQHFDTRYLVFYNPSHPSMFLSLDLLLEYRIQHGAIGSLYVTSSYSTWIFCKGVSGFATDCPCSVWCRGLTTCLLHVPPFGNRFLNNSWAVGVT